MSGVLRRLAGERLSVLDEVLRGQARRRRWRRAGLAALLLVAVMAALWLDMPSARAPSIRTLPSTVETGTVIGYIQPCSGTGFPVHTSTGARLFSSAALVEALPGQPHPQTAADGTYWVVLPAVVAAQKRVAQNQEFKLDDLVPGWYVILARYTGGGASTHAEVSVGPGQVVMVELPNTCI